MGQNASENEIDTPILSPDANVTLTASQIIQEVTRSVHQRRYGEVKQLLLGILKQLKRGQVSYLKDIGPTINECLKLPNSICVVLAALIVASTAPISLNLEFGFTTEHIQKADKLYTVFTGEEAAVFKQQVLDSMASNREQRDLLLGRSVVQIYSRSVCTQVLYLMLSTDTAITKASLAALCTLYQHNEFCLLSSEPRSLTMLCTSEDSVIAFLASTALGNYFLSIYNAHVVASDSNSDHTDLNNGPIFHSSIASLLELIADPNREFYVIESAIRALSFAARLDVYKKYIGQSLVDLKAHEDARKQRVKRIVMFENFSKACESKQLDANNACSVLEMTMWLTQPSQPGALGESKVPHRFSYLVEASEQSNRMYTYALLLILELSCSVDNQSLLNRKLKYRRQIVADKNNTGLDESLHLSCFEALAFAMSKKECNGVGKLLLALTITNLLQNPKLEDTFLISANNEILLDALSTLYSGSIGDDYSWKASSENPVMASVAAQVFSNKFLDGLIEDASDKSAFSKYSSLQDLGIQETTENSYRNDPLFNVALKRYLQRHLQLSIKNHVKETLFSRSLIHHKSIPKIVVIGISLTICYANEVKLFVSSLESVEDLILCKSSQNARNLDKIGIPKRLVTLLDAAIAEHGFVALGNTNLKKKGLAIDDTTRSIVKSTGPTVVVLLLKTINSFLVHEDVRDSIIERFSLYNLFINLFESINQGLLFLLQEFDESDNAGMPYNDNSDMTGHLNFIEVIKRDVSQELVLGISNMMPLSMNTALGSWKSPKIVNILRLLVSWSSNENTDWKRVFKAKCGLKHVTRINAACKSLLHFTNVTTTLPGTLTSFGEPTQNEQNNNGETLSLQIIRNFTRNVDDMVLWLKFESRNRMSINSSGKITPAHGNGFSHERLTEMTINSRKAEENDPILGPYKYLARMQEDVSGRLSRIDLMNCGHLGRFPLMTTKEFVKCSRLIIERPREYWGVRFKPSDVIVLGEDGLTLPNQHSISAWIVTPLPASETQKAYTLLQSKNGDCPIAIMKKPREDGSNSYELGAFDANNLAWYATSFDLEKLKPGWHHILAVVEDNKTRFHVDGGEGFSIAFATKSPLYVVGNTFQMDQPFGIVSDFRVYKIPFSIHPEEWNIYLNGRTWGVNALPSESMFPLKSPNLSSKKTLNGILDMSNDDEFWETTRDMPWTYKPPDYARYVFSLTNNGIFLSHLASMLEESNNFLKLEIVANIVGDLCLCYSIRNNLIRERIHTLLLRALSKMPKVDVDIELNENSEQIFACRNAISRAIISMS